MRRHLGSAALLLVLAAFFGLYANRVLDIDFWWHVATGRVIVETGALPHGDPFGVFSAGGPRSVTILKGYWLMQVLFYLVLQKLGTSGIIALKATLLVGCLLVLHRRAAAGGSHPAATYLVMGLAGLSLTGFTGERPQLASFLFAGVLFLLLDRYGDEGRTAWLYPVPAVMLLWANCHGGVVLGAVLLVVYAGALAAERWRAWSSGGARERNVFLAVIAVSLLMCLASPVGWNSLLTVIELEGTEFKNRVSEYASPYRLWRDTGMVEAYPYAAFLGLALVSLVPLLRGRQLARASLVLLLAALSATTFRYIPFFLVVAGPYVAVALTRMASRFLPSRPAVEAAVAAVAIVALAYGVRTGDMFQTGVEEGSFPVGAIAHLQKERASGKMLSSFEWGGYVIWNMHPGVRVYIDGRALDMTVFAKYTHMIWATPEGLQFFERERFDYVLLPRANARTGEEYALNQRLLQDPRWRLVYRDARGYLFARA